MQFQMENFFVCVVCILIYVKRLKLELDISGRFISTYISLYFQGKVPCSAKISICLCTLTAFLETGMRLSFRYPSGAPHKHSGKNLRLKFNLSSCFAFHQPLKAEKKILMKRSSILCYRVTYEMVLTRVKSKVLCKIVMFHKCVNYQPPDCEKGPRWQNSLECWCFLWLKAPKCQRPFGVSGHSPRISRASKM